MFQRFSFRLLTLPILWLVAQPSMADFGQTRRILREACGDCHDDGADEGGFVLGALGTDLDDESIYAVWQRVFERVESGEMPPEDAEPLRPAARDAVLSALEPELTRVHAAKSSTILRRLNRREYENTLNDLFGTELDLADLLPEDGRSHEFDNVGASLGVSSVHLERYLEAIETVLDAAIADRTGGPEQKTIRVSYADTREGDRFIGKFWKKLDDEAVVFYQDFAYPSGMLRGTDFDEPGRYRIRIKGYAHQSDQPITFRVGGTSFERGSEKTTYGYFSVPPPADNGGTPETIEFETWVDRRYMVEITPCGLIPKNYNIRKEGVDDYTGPGLAILHVELEGPLLTEFPSRGHHLIFDGIDRREINPRNPKDRLKSWYQPKFEIRSKDPVTDARASIRRVAEAAFRRPITDSMVRPYLELFRTERKLGTDFETALRTAISAIFCSPDFLYLHEQPGKLDDFAIASRLSYFLTRSAPDEALLQLAREGKLTDSDDALVEQTRRLLDQPRLDRFVIDFADAWLNLRDMDFTSPDDQLFPEYDEYLQYSAIGETRAFLGHLIAANLPVTNLVQSDFAILNERLAAHYDLPGVDGPELRIVQLPVDSPRGGLLSQTSVLKVSANGTNTSPVVRGVYVTERILGITPQPPPPGVPGVEPDIRGASTLRELLSKHRDNASCRSCHELIDPPGFALESFNPIGGWRDRYRSLGDGERIDLRINNRRVRYRLGQPVDASGQTFQGTDFRGFLEFRDALVKQEITLAKTLLTKLLTFATGREMGFSDRSEIARLVRESERRGHGIRDMIELVVTSSIFLHK